MLTLDRSELQSAHPILGLAPQLVEQILASESLTPEQTRYFSALTPDGGIPKFYVIVPLEEMLGKGLGSLILQTRSPNPETCNTEIFSLHKLSALYEDPTTRETVIQMHGSDPLRIFAVKNDSIISLSAR